MEPREEVEVSDLLGKYLNTMVNDLGIFNKGQYLRELFSKYEDELSRSHPQQCKKELKELDFKVIFDMLFYRTQYSVDSCKYIADEICKKFGSPVSKEVKYPEEIHLMGCSAKIGKPRGNCDCGYVMWNKCIEECKRLNGNEGI